jgi:hypothetical protein
VKKILILSQELKAESQWLEAGGLLKGVIQNGHQYGSRFIGSGTSTRN